MQQLQGVYRHTRSVQQIDRRLRHARGLLGGLGQHGVASRQRGGQLARKNGQRKVPRADADPHATRGEAQGVGLSGHAVHEVGLRVLHLRHQHGLHDALGLVGVVAQKVDRLAHFSYRVAPGLVGLLDQQGAEHRRVRQHGVGGFAQDGSALGHRQFAPLLIAAPARFISASDIFDIKHGYYWNLRGSQRSQQRVAHGGYRQV